MNESNNKRRNNAMSDTTKIIQNDSGIIDDSAIRLEETLYSKVTKRWIPFLFICYLFSYLDRANIGYAKLQMMSELKFSDTAYGFGAGLFFIAYFLFDIPSNIILQRFGARKWICRIMVTWGIISGSMMFVRSEMAFYILRFLLGVAEAGFFPGIILYLTYWYPAERRAKITAMFLTALPFSLFIGGILSGWILKTFAGVAGLSGWQWLFIIEAVPSLILGIIVFFYLDDGIIQSKWLTDQEKKILQDKIQKDALGKKSHSLGSAFTGGKVWLLGLIYFCLNIGGFGLIFWLPSIIKSMGVKDVFHIGFISAIPYGAAIIAMVLTGRHADMKRERQWHTAIPALIGGIGLAFGTYFSGNAFWAMVAFTIGMAGIITSVTMFWSLPTAFLGGMAAAAGIAIINSLGNLSGFCAPFFIGWMKDLTGGISVTLYTLAALGIVGGLLVFIIPKSIVNK
jgi:D-galactonate transporter